MAQTTSLVFNGGAIPSPAPSPSGSGKAKLLKIGEITITEQGVQVTKKVICDPDSVTMVAPFMEVLTSAKLAELVEANSILVLDDGDMQYLMANASITVEEGVSVCTAVNFLGLSKNNRAKVAYDCTRITDELTLQQVVEVGEPVETNFNLVIADSEDTDPNTLIDKMEVVNAYFDPDDPDSPPMLLRLDTIEDGQGNRKVAIDESELNNVLDTFSDRVGSIEDQLEELPSDEHGYFNSSLYQTPGDGATTSLNIDNFRISAGRDVHGDNIEFVQTHQEGGVDFGEVYLEPGTYIFTVDYTLQWVGNPRGTFLPLVANVGEQPFDFSYEHEDALRTTRIVTRTTRGKFGINFPFDADTPPMGICVKRLEIAQIASYNHPAVTHDSTLEGSGQIWDPLGVTTDVFGKVKDIPTSISQFRTGDVIPVDGPSGPAKMLASELQDAILGGPVDEVVQDWLDNHPEATTTVEDHSLTEQKFTIGLALKTIKDYVTPQMFGAVADGIADDYTAVQRCIDYAFLHKMTAFFPSGTYNVSKPVMIYGVDDETSTAFASVIIGDSKGASRIVKTTTDGLATAPYNKNAVILLGNKKEVTGQGSGIRAYGVRIEAISIDGNDLAEFGLSMPISTAECSFKEMSIVKCTDTGLIGHNNNYLNLYEKIRVSRCTECAFSVRGGNQTSNNFINCYAEGSKIGYSFSGVYLQMTNCCADNITDIVCDLSGYQGVVTGFGSESARAMTTFKGFRRTRVTIVNPTTWGNFTDDDAVCIDCGSGATMQFVGGTVSYDVQEQDRIAPGFLYKKAYSSTLILDGTQHSKFAKNNTYKDYSARTSIKKNFGESFIRYDLMAFIGADTSGTDGFIDDKSGTPSIPANAIYMGAGDTPNKLADGTSIAGIRHSSLGDIVLSRNPKDIGGIGWISAKKEAAPNDAWNSGEFLKIPVIMAGPTANRPSKAVKGQWYADSDLGNTPIFYDGTNWRSIVEKKSVTGTCDSNGIVDTALGSNVIVLGVDDSERSGWMYRWYYYNGVWKIQCLNPVSGSFATGDFSFTVYYAYKARFMLS